MYHILRALLFALFVQTLSAFRLPGAVTLTKNNLNKYPHPPPASCIMQRSAQDVIKQLNLAPHPEKGWYLEYFRDADQTNNRSHSTAIYYLLEKGQISHWHRVLDAVEIWHFYDGAPLRLSLSNDDGQPVRERILGSDIFRNETPQVIIQKREWQRAESLGQWTLVGCTVAPAFNFEGFEMAPPEWEPKGADAA